MLGQKKQQEEQVVEEEKQTQEEEEKEEQEGQKQEEYNKEENKRKTRGMIFQNGSAYIRESDLLMQQINKDHHGVTQMNCMFRDRQN